MKITLILLFALLAGSVLAQSPAFDPWLYWETRDYSGDVRLIAHPQDQYIIRGTRFTFDGIGVAVERADHPLELFDPFNADTVAAGRDNVVWDNNTGRAIGFNLFSIHF